MRRWVIGVTDMARASALLLTLAFLAGCGDYHSVTGPEIPDSPHSSPVFTFSEEDSISIGSGGFHWLPPMAPDPAATGSFDAELAPRVRVCEWDGTCAAVVAVFSMDGGTGSTTVRVDELDEHYIVNWHTERFDLDPGLKYRIQVLVDQPGQGAEVLLGHADVRVVANARDLRHVDPAYLGVVHGRTLPIRFRIETGVAGSVTVEPAAATVEVGGQQPFTATVQDLHGRPITGAPVIWSSADPGVATIGAGGRATGHEEGEVVITATSGRVSGTAILTVEAAEECLGCTLVPGMEPVVVQSAPGMAEMVAFYGVADQRISIRIDHLTSFCAIHTVRGPDGEVVIQATSCGTYFTDLLVLGATGQHRIEMVPLNGASINARVTIWEVPPDVWTETAIDGEPGLVVIEAPGQNAFVTFPGASGDRITVLVERTFGCGLYELRAPSGAVLWSRFACGNPYSDLLVLPEAGTWTLFVNPHRDGVGQAAVRVRSVPLDARAETTIDGEPGVVVMEAPGQNAFVTFPGTSGDRITVLVERSFGCGLYELRAPSGAVLWGPFACGNPYSDLLVLSETGTWTLFIDPHLDGVGQATVRVRSVPPDARAETTIDGEPALVVIEAPAQNAFVTFPGASGDRITVLVERTFGCGLYLLRAPSGAEFWRRFDCGDPFTDLLVLPETGTWTLFIDPHLAGVGQATVRVRSVPLDAEGIAIVGGERVDLAITAPAQNARVGFEGLAGQQVTVHSDRVSGGCARYTLLGPDAQVIGGLNGVLRCGALSESVTLPAVGAYALLIDPNGTWTGLTRTMISEP